MEERSIELTIGRRGADSIKCDFWRRQLGNGIEQFGGTGDRGHQMRR